MDLHVQKMSYLQPVALDDDGTPLVHGERCVEVAPGVWKEPVVLAIEKFLEQNWPQDWP